MAASANPLAITSARSNLAETRSSSRRAIKLLATLPSASGSAAAQATEPATTNTAAADR